MIAPATCPSRLVCNVVYEEGEIASVVSTRREDASAAKPAYIIARAPHHRWKWKRASSLHQRSTPCSRIQSAYNCQRSCKQTLALALRCGTLRDENNDSSLVQRQPFFDHALPRYTASNVLVSKAYHDSFLTYYSIISNTSSMINSVSDRSQNPESSPVRIRSRLKCLPTQSQKD